MCAVDMTGRESVVEALVSLSMAADYQDRRDAGVGLVPFADVAPAGVRLGELVLDPEDTAVTRAVVEALMRRRDVAAVAVVAAAVASADEDHSQWIEEGITDALGWMAWPWDEAIEACKDLDDAPGASDFLFLLQQAKPDPSRSS
jgi:hypothetical protein